MLLYNFRNVLNQYTHSYFPNKFNSSKVYMTTTLDEIKEILLVMNKNIEKLNEKMDVMCSKLDGEVIDECKKMSSQLVLLKVYTIV